MQPLKRAASSPLTALQKRTHHPLYEPLDFVAVRTPLFPIESYLDLPNHTASTLSAFVMQTPTLQTALAVGSPALLAAVEKDTLSPKELSQRERKLLRYLIRMSTRPTPYGLFAGLALAEWKEQTNIALATLGAHLRARPDMGWLLHLVRELEALPEVRAHLSFVRNSAASIRRGRIFLLEPLPDTQQTSNQSLSIKATNVARQALALARCPIQYSDLLNTLVTATPRATPQKVEGLLTMLWQLSFLMTDLRPPLTDPHPIHYIMQRLSAIPLVAPLLLPLQEYLASLSNWQTLAAETSSAMYSDIQAKAHNVEQALRALVSSCRERKPYTEALSRAQSGTLGASSWQEQGRTLSPIQVDMAHHLLEQGIHPSIGTDAAQAAELLLRLGRPSHTNQYLAAYRQTFLARYGEMREVPLLELLDPQFGLGLPPAYTKTDATEVIRSSAPRNSLREQTLLDIAASSLHDRQLVVQLDEETITKLGADDFKTDRLPPSVEIVASVVAASPEEVDAGHYQLVLAPATGSWQAGSSLARFADLLGPDAYQALQQAVRQEEARMPDALHAEIVYLPQDNRMSNVIIRPAMRDHELVYGVMPGVPCENVIPMDELSIGIRNSQFYVRWTTKNSLVVFHSGHMLNSISAPGHIRFLYDISYDYVPQLTAFQWGPCSTFPFLPRIQVGRIVLCCAQWRITSDIHRQELHAETVESFQRSLAAWREHWNVPRYVYLSAIDNRLLLDLEQPQQAEELRRELQQAKNSNDLSLVLQEGLPDPAQMWLEGPDGHYMAEFAISLVLREKAATASTDFASRASPVKVQAEDISILPLQPPGSDWLFVKLYCAQTLQDDFIAGSIRSFAHDMITQGYAEEWFFIRYGDPEPHVRLRFRGRPALLLEQALPRICTWATQLMSAGPSLKFVFDTYEREIARYGGSAGLLASETLFCADSVAVAALLSLLQMRKIVMDRQLLVALTIDDLLAQLGLTQAGRLTWYKSHVTLHPASGKVYRQKSVQLRSLLGTYITPTAPDIYCCNELVGNILQARRTTLLSVAQSLAQAKAQHRLTVPLDSLYRSFVHMHCNRFLGIDREAEQEVLELLLRTHEGLQRSPLSTTRKGSASQEIDGAGMHHQ